MVAPRGFGKPNPEEEIKAQKPAAPEPGEAPAATGNKNAANGQTRAEKRLTDEEIAKEAGTDTEVELLAGDIRPDLGEVGSQARKDELRRIVEKRLGEDNQRKKGKEDKVAQAQIDISERYEQVSNSGRGQIVLKKRRRDANGNEFLSPEKVVVYDMGQVSEAMVTPDEMEETMQALERADSDELKLNASTALQTLVPRAFETMESTYGFSPQTMKRLGKQFAKRMTAHTSNMLGADLDPKTGKPGLDIMPGVKEDVEALIKGTGIEVDDTGGPVETIEEELGGDTALNSRQAAILEQVAEESDFNTLETMTRLIDEEGFFDDVPANQRRKKIEEVYRAVDKFGDQAALIEMNQKVGQFETAALEVEQSTVDQIMTNQVRAMAGDPEKIKAFIAKGLNKYSNNIQGAANRLSASMTDMIDRSINGDKDLNKFVTATARDAIERGDEETFRREMINSAMSHMRENAEKLGVIPAHRDAALQRIHNQTLNGDRNQHPAFNQLVDTLGNLYKRSIGIDTLKEQAREQELVAAREADPSKVHQFIGKKRYALTQEEANLAISDPQAAIAAHDKRQDTETAQRANESVRANELRSGVLTIFDDEGNETSVALGADPQVNIDNLEKFKAGPLSDAFNPLSPAGRRQLLSEADELIAKNQEELLKGSEVTQEELQEFTDALDVFSRPFTQATPEAGNQENAPSATPEGQESASEALTFASEDEVPDDLPVGTKVIIDGIEFEVE